MQLGSYIKSRRLNLGLTHKQLAEKNGHNGHNYIKMGK